jgi:hypothetical protein
MAHAAHVPFRGDQVSDTTVSDAGAAEVPADVPADVPVVMDTPAPVEGGDGVESWGSESRDDTPPQSLRDQDAGTDSWGADDADPDGQAGDAPPVHEVATPVADERLSPAAAGGDDSAEDVAGDADSAAGATADATDAGTVTSQVDTSVQDVPGPDAGRASAATEDATDPEGSSVGEQDGAALELDDPKGPVVDDGADPRPDAGQRSENDAPAEEAAAAATTQGMGETAVEAQGTDQDSREPAEVRGELGARLQDVWQTSAETDAGRCYYEPDDTTMRDFAAAVIPEPDRYTVDAHGDAERVYVGSEALSPPDVAALIRYDDRWGGQPVRLMSCETGQGDDCFAQGLADELRVGVSAPDQLAWSDAFGRVYSASAWEDEYGVMHMTNPPDGTWREFQPRNEGDS